MTAYQVYNNFEKVGCPFQYMKEAQIFAKLKDYNMNVIPVQVRPGELFRDGNRVFMLTLDGYTKPASYIPPGDPLRM